MAATATPVHDSTDCNRTPPKPVRAAKYYNVHYTVSVLLLGWSEHKKNEISDVGREKNPNEMDFHSTKKIWMV